MRTFDDIYAAHAGQVLKLAAGLVGQQDARDLAQQVWIRVFLRLPSYRGEATLFTWIHRITVNLSTDHFRRLARARIASWVPIDEQVLQVPAPQVWGESRLITQEQRAELARRIATLPAVFRRAILLHLAGTPLKRARIPQGTQKSRVFRAKALVGVAS